MASLLALPLLCRELLVRLLSRVRPFFAPKCASGLPVFERQRWCFWSVCDFEKTYKVFENLTGPEGELPMIDVFINHFFRNKSLVFVCLLRLLNTCLNQDSHGFNKAWHFSKVDNPAIKTVAGSGPKNTRPHRFLKPVRSVSGEVVCINTDLENRNRP